MYPAFLKSENDSSLLEYICRTATSSGVFKTAVYATIENDSEKIQFKYPPGVEMEYLEDLHNSQDFAVYNDIENENITPDLKTSLLVNGCYSGIFLSIKKISKPAGVLMLFSDEKRFFCAEVIAALQSFGEHVSYALNHYEEEKIKNEKQFAVATSGRHYETLAERSPVGIFHTDASGYTTYVNPRWSSISGLSFEEAIGNGWLCAVHEDDKETLQQRWIEATTAMKLSTSEYRFVRPDGTIAWVIGQALPETNAENNVVGYIGTITDITRLKLTEEKIKRSNTQLSLSQQIAHIGYWELELNCEAGYWSDEMYRIVQKENNGEPMKFSMYVANIHIEDRQAFIDAHNALINEKQQLNIEYRFVVNDGSVCNLHSLGNLVTDKDGRSIMIVGITQDITRRKRNEDEILKEKQLSDSIINSLPGVFYLYTREGKFLRWNRNLENMTHLSHEEIAQMHPLAFFYKEDRERVAAKIENTFLVGEDRLEADMNVDEKRIPYYFTGIAVDYEGQLCLMGLAMDISERVESQERIQETSEQLRRLALHLQSVREEERKRIGREIHDELGQQLTAIKMDAAWIDKNTPPGNVQIKRKLTNIIALLDESNKSIRRILSELRSGIFDDHDLLSAIEWLGKNFTENTGIPVRFSFPESGVNTTEPIANCIFRLCQEAFTNITRHSHASQVSVTVTIIDNIVAAVVEDDGVGFDTGAVQNGKSFGILGMKERVQSLGGIFEIISSPGTGTAIALQLPYITAGESKLQHIQ